MNVAGRVITAPSEILGLWIRDLMKVTADKTRSSGMRSERGVGACEAREQTTHDYWVEDLVHVVRSGSSESRLPNNRCRSQVGRSSRLQLD